MKASLLIEVHGWRGFGKTHDLFCIELFAGFVTVIICRTSLTDRLAEIANLLREAKRKLGGEE